MLTCHTSQRLYTPKTHCLTLIYDTCPDNQHIHHSLITRGYSSLVFTNIIIKFINDNCDNLEQRYFWGGYLIAIATTTTSTTTPHWPHCVSLQ